MVTALEYNVQKSQSNDDNQFYRLFVIGKKSLPEIRDSEARASERCWARVGGVFENEHDLTKELFSDEFRKGDGARPTGFGKYIIVRHKNHTEIAYKLETPKNQAKHKKNLA